MKLIASLIMLFLLIGGAKACAVSDYANIYVSPNGSGTNGTLDCPANLTWANQTIVTGGNIRMIDGTYTDTIIQTNSSIAYRRYNGTPTMDKSSVSISTAAFNIGAKDNITIDGITIKNYYYGILVGSGSDNNTFSNNTIISGDGVTTAGYGIVFDTSAATVSNTVIKDSTFLVNKTNSAIKIYGDMKNVSIYNNTFNDTIGNVGVTPLNRAIMIDSGSDNHQIYNNNMTVQGVRVYIDTSDNNIIHDNYYGAATSQNCVEIFYDSRNNTLYNDTCYVTGGSGYVLWSAGTLAPNNTQINNVSITTNHNFGIAIRGGNYTTINNTRINMTGNSGTVNSGIGIGYDGFRVHTTIIKNTNVNIVSATSGRAVFFGEHPDSPRNSITNVTLTGGDYDIFVSNSTNDAAIDSFFTSLKMNDSSAIFTVINTSNNPFNTSLGHSAYHYLTNSSMILSGVNATGITFTSYPFMSIFATNSTITPNNADGSNFTVTNNAGTVSKVNYSNVTNGWQYHLNNASTINSTNASGGKVSFINLNLINGAYRIENQSILAPSSPVVNASSSWSDLEDHVATDWATWSAIMGVSIIISVIAIVFILLNSGVNIDTFQLIAIAGIVLMVLILFFAIIPVIGYNLDATFDGMVR